MIDDLERTNSTPTQRAIGAVVVRRMTPARERFLRHLVSRGGTRSSEDLDVKNSYEGDQARQWCKRHGLAVIFGGYWTITEAGREALRRIQSDK